MKSLAMFLALAIAAVATIAATEDVTAKMITVTGEVVRYDGGRTIVLRGVDGADATYAIAPALAVAAEVGVGRRVTIVTEPSETGAVLVTRITLDPSQPAGPARGQMTSAYGTVTAYEQGRSITLLRPNATTVTYVLDADTSVPSGLARGRKVVIRTITRAGGRPVVRKVSYSKTETKTKTVR
jgi:hypothetical protein